MAIPAANLNAKVEALEGKNKVPAISPLSSELVIALIGYAGSGCSSVAKILKTELHEQGYTEPKIVKLSKLIEGRCGSEKISSVDRGSEEEGKQKLVRAKDLQNFGDELRKEFGNHAVASLGIQEIIKLRGENSVGAGKVAFIIDSIKHPEEVELLRRVYDKSFRLVAIHCERDRREGRLIGDARSGKKYRGANSEDIRKYLDRDEKDTDRSYGQQVREAFHQADYFLDNNIESADAVRVAGDLQRFVNLILANDLVRPTKAETGMFYAQAAALRSSCLSRQVGAALQSPDGNIISTGTNDIPVFGGGVADESNKGEHRCFAWEWKEGEQEFTGCHNTRLKNKLRSDIAKWMVDSFAENFSMSIFPIKKEGLFDTEKTVRQKVELGFRKFFTENSAKFEKMPGVKDIIEYSRSIHAEMNALFNASAQGVSSVGCILYTSTFPCHNCARHLVTAGIKIVYYIEPFTKSMATNLHSDSLTTEREEDGQNKMKILPFTGVGPRLYEEYFLKRIDLKNDQTGAYKKPGGESLTIAVRLNDLANVEKRAAELVSE